MHDTVISVRTENKLFYFYFLFYFCPTLQDDVIGERVRQTYLEMHTHQTVDFVRGRHAAWLSFNHVEATVMEALGQSNSSGHHKKCGERGLRKDRGDKGRGKGEGKGGGEGGKTR